MKIHVVVNPNGASGRTGQQWDKLEPLFRERSELVVHYSTREKGIGEICREIETEAAAASLKVGAAAGKEKLAAADPAACDEIRPEDRVNIVIAGGDGSFNDAINGIEDPDRVNFGLLPCGSGNDFARDMEWPDDITGIAETILEGKVVHRLDIGELRYADTNETRRFNVSAGIGFDAAICELAGRSKFKNILNKIHLGKLIYIFSAFQVIGGQKNLPVEVIADGTSHKYDHMLLVSLMNHRFEGGGYMFAPDADASDGIMDVCVADPKHNSFFYVAFPSVAAGTHFQKFDFLEELHGHEVEVRTSIPLFVHTDGEVKRKADHIYLKILDKKMNLLA